MMDEVRTGPGGTEAKERGEEPMLRLALLSTPRSGNTWTRALLGSLYELKQLPIHKPEELDWDNLPRRCVIQLHWYPNDPFPQMLEQHHVQPVVLARHPLDGLMSWLNYVYYIHQEGYCPGGGECLDCPIVGVSPRSEAFLEWTRTEYARCFLYHSPSWWIRPGVIQVRYEDLVEDTEQALGVLTEALGETPRIPIREVVAANAIGRKKPGQDVWHFHYWQGQPGLWKRLIPATEAREIARSIPEPFEMLGYPCDPDETLGPFEADLNWNLLQLDSTREHLRLERAKHRKTIKDLLGVQNELEVSVRKYQDELEAHERTKQELIQAQSSPSVLRPLKGIAKRILRTDPGQPHQATRARVAKSIEHAEKT